MESGLLTSDKVDFRGRKIITRTKEGHYIMIKGSIHKEDRTIMNVYAPNNRTIKHMRVKSERNERVTDKSTNVVEDIKTTLLITDRTSRQKISKDLKEMNKTINERDKNDTDKNTSPKE